jgi:hypothetical protein
MAPILSGQITVTTAGTAVRGPDVSAINFLSGTLYSFELKAHPSNTDAVWVGNDGANDITNANSFPLNPGETAIVEDVNLNQYWFDANVSGEKICWLVI